MDVEGSDGRERGEDDTSFERQSGVFAFAVSDIVLINMFYTSVGLDNGASKPLLKHVFQGVLRLPTKPRKTTLMFVIRDIIETTDLETSKPILGEDIQKIWDSIPKPEHHKRTPLSTFFNIEIVGLPNFKERKEQFKEQVMIANMRSGEIADKILKDFVANKERRQLEEGAQTNPATGFGKKYNSIINSYLHGYEKETEYYDGGFRSEKRKDLIEKMMLVVQSAFRPILANISSNSLKEFKEVFCNAVDRGEDADTKYREACLKSFNERCADVIVEQANCNTKEEREKLEDGIEKIVLQAKYEVQKHKAKKNAIAAGVGGAVMATGAIGAGAVMFTVGLPATVVATAATGVVAGSAFLGTMAGSEFSDLLLSLLINVYLVNGLIIFDNLILV
ncbi:hypothetical protein RHGRI_035245 [Rhododendron griersonianum]|uniref:GB1/RHD3-type G domain-containing protein n=1 Tax=Rhododendron griersonianum TaxID=479676 RepID=A0AAV6I7P3_9ERIC|nr:hypothetical protein RHGRI_035245 [Rhododendron griersonianum]